LYWLFNLEIYAWRFIVALVFVKVSAMKRRKIAIADLHIGKKAKEYVLKTLDSNRLSYGPMTEDFERQFAKIHRRKYAMVSNSGTSALQVALHALKEKYGWEDGDEVILPAVTFIASSNVVLHNRLKPVFVDVEPNYYCIDPKKIEAAITKRTKAIMPVHLFGQSADMKRIMAIAKRHDLRVIEDSCEAMFVKYMGEPVGSMGDVAVFSTYVAHIIVTGVGGIAVTNDDSLATTMKSLMFHGRDSIYLKMEDDDTQDRLKLNSLIERRFQFEHVGYSYRITEMESALGLAELENKERIIAGRKKVGRMITKALGPFKNYFQLPEVRDNAEHIYMLFPIVIKDTRIDKEDLLLFLEENGVETRLFMPLLNQPIYKKLFGDIEKNYPVARHLVRNGFIIGSHQYLGQKDAEYLNYLFRQYLKGIGL